MRTGDRIKFRYSHRPSFTRKAVILEIFEDRSGNECVRLLDDDLKERVLLKENVRLLNRKEIKTDYRRKIIDK